MHLQDRLINAEDANDTKKYKQYLRLLVEKNNSQHPCLGAITKVDKPTIDGVIEISDLDGMANEIQQVTKKGICPQHCDHHHQ